MHTVQHRTHYNTGYILVHRADGESAGLICLSMTKSLLTFPLFTTSSLSCFQTLSTETETGDIFTQTPHHQPPGDHLLPSAGSSGYKGEGAVRWEQLAPVSTDLHILSAILWPTKRYF